MQPIIDTEAENLLSWQGWHGMSRGLMKSCSPASNGDPLKKMIHGPSLQMLGPNFQLTCKITHLECALQLSCWRASTDSTSLNLIIHRIGQRSSRCPQGTGAPSFQIQSSLGRPRERSCRLSAADRLEQTRASEQCFHTMMGDFGASRGVPRGVSQGLHIN